MANPPKNRGYPDLKYKFIRGLIKAEHQQRRHQFLKDAAQWTSKAIVSLSLTDQPIRSAKQASQLEGIGDTIKGRLDKILKEDRCSADPPLPGRHTSTGSGLLVALLNESEAIGSSEGGKPLVMEDDLKSACAEICDEKFNAAKPSPDGTPAMCPAWWRLNVLISRGYIKKRTRGKHPVYELLPDGEDIARRLRGTHIPPPRDRPSPVPTSANKSPATKTKTAKRNLSNSSQDNSSQSHRGPLYSTDTGADGVILLVDNHELGGDRVRLGELSRRLHDWGVQHRTCALPSGDYQWVWRDGGREMSLPILVERKRADDLAESMKDGRFIKQKDRMRNWRSEFGILSDEVSLQYMVESTPAAYRVACMDGCNGVGKCGNPSVEQVEVAIDELRKSQEFTLVQTGNVEVSVEYLATVTADLKRRVSQGDFDTLRFIHNRPGTSRSSSKRQTTTSPRNTPSGSSRKSPLRESVEVSYVKKQSASTSSSCAFGSCPSPRKRKPYVAIGIDDMFDDYEVKRSRMGTGDGISIKDDFEDSQGDDIFNVSVFADTPRHYSSSRTSGSADFPLKNEDFKGSHSSSNARKEKPSTSWLDKELDFFDDSCDHPSQKKHERINLTSSSSCTTSSPLKSERNAAFSGASTSGTPVHLRELKPFDDEDKIHVVREVMPDSSRRAVINALISAEGSIDGAVMILLEGPNTHKERARTSTQSECIDLT